MSGGGSGSLSLGRVDDPSSCADNGWHYDDNDAPTRVIACPGTCGVIESEGHSAVQILLGCASRGIDLE